MNKALGALAAALLMLVLLAPPAEARCWYNGYRWHCTHHRYHHHVWRYRYYRPYYPAVYPAYYPYAYYPYYRPYYVCIPFWPFCG